MRHASVPMTADYVAVFPTAVGWMVAQWRGETLTSLTFGDRSERAARQRAALPRDAVTTLQPAMQSLVARLQQYADGEPIDFRDVPLDWSGRTAFQRAVLEQCRRIPFGAVATYAELAARAGRPHAARAVGNVMASNRVPLVIPCHRVVGASGALGGFSAPDGVRMKRRLLSLEGREL